METELAQRETDGITVTLFWNRENDRLTVTVRDLHTGAALDLNAKRQNALDVFHHPYAYAARRGLLMVSAEPVYA